VFVKVLNKFQDKEVFQKCATFKRSHFATLLFLHSGNKLLIPPLFLLAFKGGLSAIFLIGNKKVIISLLMALQLP